MKFTITILIVLCLLVCSDNIISQNNPYPLWSTYFGGSDIEYGTGVTSDNSGNIYITGVTSSSNFPVSSGAIQSLNAGQTDAFIIKFNNSGQRLWSTYYGGSGTDQGRCITTDNNGNIFITGITNSSDFPITNGAFQTQIGGQYDLFIVKLNSQGEKLWATFYGGNNDDEGSGICKDLNGNILISGFTNSMNFPVSTNALQQNNSGGYDAFILKFNNQGQRIWATYYGGSSDEDADGINVDLNNNIIITGFTTSTNFPFSNSGFQTTNAGGSDAFVVKLTNSGQRIWATYYGGALNDLAYGGVATDRNGSIVISGWTLSQNFPVTSGAFQTLNAGDYDAFIVKFDSTGMRGFATYYGGINDDRGEGITVDTSNNIIVSGYTNSQNFPVSAEALQINNAGNYDNFIIKFNMSGQRQWATYYGGGNNDQCYTICSSINNNIIFSGRTHSTNFPVTQSAFQMFNSGNDDIFIAEFDYSPIGIHPISTSIPKIFKLYQNYPNPFNPLTKIKFDIPVILNSGLHPFVQLKLFDVQGKEIAILLNESLLPGSYEINWNASVFTSGVYFYRLSSGNFTETNKLILIK